MTLLENLQISKLASLQKEGANIGAVLQALNRARQRVMPAISRTFDESYLHGGTHPGGSFGGSMLRELQGLGNTALGRSNYRRGGFIGNLAGKADAFANTPRGATLDRSAMALTGVSPVLGSLAAPTGIGQALANLF